MITVLNDYRGDTDMRFIYARVSTTNQNVEQQVVELEKHHGQVDEVLTDKASGKNTNRPALQSLLGKIRKGDTVIVYDISRLGRSLDDVTSLVERFRKSGVAVVIHSLGQTDVCSSAGQIILGTLAGVAHMQREEMLEKQAIGIARAKSEGKYEGRGKDARTKAQVIELLAGGMSISKVASQVDVGVSTVQRIKKVAVQ